jgi:hypothetical protein
MIRRNAVDAENDRLAIDDELLLAVLERGFDNPRIAVRPIVPVAGNQPHAIAVALDAQPVTVVLDLVEPVRARSRSPSVAGAAIPTSTSDPPASCCASDTRPPRARYLRRRAPPTPTRITAGWPTWNTATTRWRCSTSVLARIVSDGSLGRFSRAHVKETDRVKQLGFYVDLDDQMRVRLTPSQVTSELAKDRLNFAREVLETLRSISLIWTA